MPTEIEQIADGGVSTQERLRLIGSFESTHHTFSNPGWLMGLLCTIVCILIRNMYRFKHYFPMRHRAATQLIRYTFSRLFAV